MAKQRDAVYCGALSLGNSASFCGFCEVKNANCVSKQKLGKQCKALRHIYRRMDEIQNAIRRGEWKDEK